MLEGGCRAEGDKGEKKHGATNSIINKIYLKMKKENILDFAVYNVLPCIMCRHVFGPNFQEKNLSF